MDEIVSVRNSLAHFRPINSDDIDLIKQNARHMLGTIEDTVTELITCRVNVPSNTDAAWYNALKSLNTEHCIPKLMQSAETDWIQLIISFNAPVVTRRRYPNSSFFYEVMNLSPLAILEQNESLRGHLIYLTESTKLTRINDQGNDSGFGKELRFGFSRAVLEEQHSNICEQLNRVLSLIEEEINLINDDNLARGSLVDVVTTRAAISEGRTSTVFDSKPFRSAPTEDTPPEWWGSLSPYISNFVSDSETYPWMPTKVSESEFPF